MTRRTHGEVDINWMPCPAKNSYDPRPQKGSTRLETGAHEARGESVNDLRDSVEKVS